MFYVHAIMKAGVVHQLPANYAERAAYVVSGSIECDGRVSGPGQMLVFTRGAIQLSGQSHPQC